MVKGVIGFGKENLFTTTQKDYDRAPYEIKQLMLVAGFKLCPDVKPYHIEIISEDRAIKEIKINGTTFKLWPYGVFLRPICESYDQMVRSGRPIKCIMWKKGHFFETIKNGWMSQVKNND